MSQGPGSFVLRNAEVPGLGLSDLRIADGVVSQVARHLTADEHDHVVDARGGALLPGLADHHLHLAALAAAEDSTDLRGCDRDQALGRLAAAEPSPDGWIRAVGYDDVAAGDLGRDELDEVAAGPARVQHRSGAMWVVNSAALDRLGARSSSHPGIERDHDGRPTGRLYRADNWVRAATGPRPVSLARVGARLASLGITHVSDATPGDDHVPLVVAACASGDLPQRVALMSATALDPASGVGTGPRKIVVADHAPPDFADLVRLVDAARQQDRAVAFHCVTESALALALAAVTEVGPRPGDRIEHAALARRGLIEAMAERGLTVVTQPSLPARYGDSYWSGSDPADRDALWPYASLLAAGVPTAPSSDAPYGDVDPWAGMVAAAERRTSSGRLLGREEAVPAADVLAGLLTPLADPGGNPRRVEVGAPADLVLLSRPLAAALAGPTSADVRTTFIAGRVVFGEGT